MKILLFREVNRKTIAKKIRFYKVQINCISHRKTWNKFYILQNLNELDSSVFKPFINHTFWQSLNNVQVLQSLHKLYFPERMLHFSMLYIHVRAGDRISLLSSKFYLHTYSYKVCPLLYKNKVLLVHVFPSSFTANGTCTYALVNLVAPC